MTALTSNAEISPVAEGRAALLRGDPSQAAALLERHLASAPADLEARYWLASAKLTASAPDAADAMDQARILHTLLLLRGMDVDVERLQVDAAYAAAVAGELYAGKLIAMSGVVRKLALSAGFDGQSWLSYGLCLQHQGRIDEALEAFGAVAERLPSAAAHQFQIYPHLFGENGEARHLAAARAWARLYAPERSSAMHHNPPRAGRRLNIGYVAPWFATSQLAQFMAPLLENHDPAQVSVTLYPTDSATETRWPHWIKTRSLGGLDDAAAAALIRQDEIDVLADCWGHSSGSRLTVFAHRPAPVQVAWINYIQTSGLSQIDYVLHADSLGSAPIDKALYVEDIWPIGPVFNAFRPAPGRLPPVSTPALATGQVTFASFNHPAKLSGVALDAWASILRGAPQARLVLKYGYFADPVLQRATQARFAARGVAPERIQFEGHTTGEAYHRAFQNVDVMLDAWPAPGSTTTLEALSNGVPVLVMPATPTNRLYLTSILSACGLADLVATSAEDFVARALRLAGDLPGLEALRRRVRPGFDGGACCDEVGFTRRVEAAFGEMFDLWAARDQKAARHG